MPGDAIVGAIVSTIISSVAEGIFTPSPELPGVGIVRALPQETRKGVMSPAPTLGQVVIDGKLMQLSPGVQIRNELNMIVMPSMLNRPAKVRYMVDLAGSVHRIWILSATEVTLPENR